MVATRDADLRRQLRDVLEAGGLTVEATDDVTGAELAGCAKNAAALAAAAAAPRGANLAGAAAGRVFSEIHELAVASGARSETFAGLAGTGDLVATALAEGSRNRRAGELVGAGVPAGQVQAAIGPDRRVARDGAAARPTRSSARGSRRRSPPACAACSTARPRPSSGSRQFDRPARRGAAPTRRESRE